MRPITTGELARIRQFEMSRLFETIEVLAFTSTSDGMGGNSGTWATPTVVMTLPGRVQPSKRRPQDVEIGGGTHISQLWDIVLPSGVTISPTARLRWNGTQYAVIADDEPHSLSVATHVTCYEVT